MKSKKILLVILMALAIIIGNVNFVYADSFSVDMGLSTDEYAPGQTVILTVSLSNIDSSAGIYGLTGILEYKTEIFEEIVSDGSGNTTQITSLNGWGNATYNSETKKFSILTTTPAKSTQSIMQIALKIREDAPLGKATVMLNDLTSTNSQEDIETSPVTASITIKDASEIGGGSIPSIVTTPTPSTTPTATPTSSPITVSSPKVTPTPNTSNLPQTGIGDSPAPILFGALLICLGSYIAYRRYRDI